MKSDHFSYDDAIRKLSGCIVLHKGEPVYVSNNDGAKVNLFITPIGKDFNFDKGKKIHFNSDELDIAIPTLGYCNYGLQVYYLSRALGRINKQGISRDTIDSVPRFPDEDILYSEGLVNTIKNIYPAFDECLKTISERNGPNAMAFNRHLAIHYNGNHTLHYRARSIGSLNVKSKTINIFPGEQASFFDRLIKEMNIPYEVQ